MNFQMEINRWKFSINACNNGQIPDLVHANEFQDMLEDVHTALESSIYTPTIPTKCGVSCHNIGLTSCMFTETEYVVNILIPVSVRGTVF